MDTVINPQISIVMITKNRADFISKAVKSIQNQSFIDWELLILDDDSNDDTEAILAPIIAHDSRIKYYKNSPTLGISSNRNKGLSLAQGKYIAVLDSDDFWLDNNKLQKQYDFLEKNQDYILIGSNIKIIDKRGNFIKKTSFATEDAEIRKKILTNNQIAHSSIIMRKNIIIKAGQYQSDYSEDFNLFLRMGLLGKLKNIQECTTAYTRHNGANSQKRKLQMAWSHFITIWKNIGKYPNWFKAIIWAKLRLFKSLF